MKRTTAHYDRVKEFMGLTGRETPEEVTIPDEKIRLLQARLILEEAFETVMALGINITVSYANADPEWTVQQNFIDITDWKNWSPMDFFHLIPTNEPNLEQVIDGCTDISVVTTGTLIAFGLPDVPFLEETDTANLRKFEEPKCPECNIKMKREEGIQHWYWRCIYDNRTLAPKAGPYTHSDGKHIKPPYWTPPNHLQHIPKWIQ